MFLNVLNIYTANIQIKKGCTNQDAAFLVLPKHVLLCYVFLSVQDVNLALGWVLDSATAKIVLNVVFDCLYRGRNGGCCVGCENLHAVNIQATRSRVCNLNIFW